MTIGPVTCYLLTCLKLLPKSWLAKEHIAHVNAISCVFLEALDTSCCMSVISVSIANYTEPANFTKAMMTPDNKEWKDACDSKMSTLEYSFLGFGYSAFCCSSICSHSG